MFFPVCEPAIIVAKLQTGLPIKILRALRSYFFLWMTKPVYAFKNTLIWFKPNVVYFLKLLPYPHHRIKCMFEDLVLHSTF